MLVELSLDSFWDNYNSTFGAGIEQRSPGMIESRHSATWKIAVLGWDHQSPAQCGSANLNPRAGFPNDDSLLR
jgi:hypothetical protein